MKLERLEEILGLISETHVLVAGDFFLDQYWLVDPALEEISLETDLPAHQVSDTRLNPGAAGTVANNLAALGVGQVAALGVIGDDGNGVELLKGLAAKGVQTTGLVVTSERRTPVYTKPLALPTQVEMERFDIKNRCPLSIELEDVFLKKLNDSIGLADGVAILDQVQEENCGVITARVREKLGTIAREHRDKPFLADSRTQILRFKHVLIKPNQNEASMALSIPTTDKAGLMKSLASMSQSSVFMTCGAEGISLFDGTMAYEFPALPISGPIDIVGAGDSVSAAIVSSLCAGTSLQEAAQLANLVASVTIRKLGTTGTATHSEIMGTAEYHLEVVENWPN